MENAYFKPLEDIKQPLPLAKLAKNAKKGVLKKGVRVPALKQELF
jgi:hypothetical protein